jgi:hypothetical protein
MEPRYQCVALGPVWSWRLLGSNHRELARAASRFGSLAEAADDALRTAAEAPTATIEVLLAPDGTWHWAMSVDGTSRAASAVGYARRLECSRAVDRFRESAPVAAVSPTPLVHRRLGTRPRPAGAESSRAELPPRLRPPNPR